MKPTPYHYVILRKDLSGGIALAHVLHAAGESAALWSLSRCAAASRGAGITTELTRRISFGAQRGLFTPDGAAPPVDPLEHQLPVDTRGSVLGATKEQLATLLDALLRENVQHKVILETDGPLENVVTAVGLVTDDRDSLKPLLGHLKPFKLGGETAPAP